MTDSFIPLEGQIRAVPIRNKEGQLLCTAYFDVLDTTFDARYEKAKKALAKVCKRVIKVSLKNDGSPASLRYAPSVALAEREIKRVITDLFYIDDLDGLFADCRPFASVKGEFYVTHVLNALAQAARPTIELERA